MKTETIKIKDLKKDDKVVYYGAVMIITKDARESVYSKGVYIAECDVLNTDNCSEGTKDALIDYDYFQGNEDAKVARVI